MNGDWGLPRGLARWLAAMVFVIGLGMGTAPAGQAQPPGAPPNPYPDENLIWRSYQRHDPAEYFTASASGVWFTSPSGLNCGIWDRGDFGCIGDIHSPGGDHIGWVKGNIVVRHDGLLNLQFPPGRAEQPMLPRSYVEYNGTTCAVMSDTSTYCSRGPYKFFITPTQTWLSPP
ncbi:MAG: hypothetical protein QOD58_2267 [Mycobacterium sp.]|nr:hypothetical protein [Mycobacterium sp.]